MKDFIKKYEGDIIILTANLAILAAFIIVYLSR